MVKFAENGSLLDYIRTHKKQPDYINTMTGESSAISNIEILQLAHGIAKGMNHLAKVKVRKPTKCYLIWTKRHHVIQYQAFAKDWYSCRSFANIPANLALEILAQSPIQRTPSWFFRRSLPRPSRITSVLLQVICSIWWPRVDINILWELERCMSCGGHKIVVIRSALPQKALSLHLLSTVETAFSTKFYPVG